MDCSHHRNSHERGAALVTTMLLILVMALMGVALVETSLKSARTANIKAVDTETFHLAESCAHELSEWLGSQNRPPDDSILPHTVTRDNLNHLLTGEESEKTLNQLEGFSYGCSITMINTQSVSADHENVGTEVSVVEGYGAAGDISPRYYYDITATSNGPMNAEKRIITVVSLEY